jgi:hypothetical protein
MLGAERLVRIYWRNPVRMIRRSMLVLSSMLTIGSLMAGVTQAAAQGTNPSTPNAAEKVMADPFPSADAQGRAALYSSVDWNRDCTKPYSDRKAPSGRVFLRGMTPIEREVCSTFLNRSK